MNTAVRPRNSGDASILDLERERQDFWRVHAHWSEDERCMLWTRQLAARFERTSTPRSYPPSGLAEDVDRHHGNADGRSRTGRRPSDNLPVAMARTNMSKHASAPPPPPRQLSNPGKRPHQQMETTHSAPPALDSAHWTGTRHTYHQLDTAAAPVVSFEPSAFVSKLEHGLDTSNFTTAAKRPRVEGYHGTNHPSLSVAYPYHVSPSTSDTSSNLSPLSLMTLASSEAMSRQTSTTTDASIVDGVDMLRFDSCFSSFSDCVPFPFDCADDSFLSSCDGGQYFEGGAVGGTDEQCLSGMGQGFLPQDFSYLDQTPSNVVGEQHHTQDMQRSISDQSTASSSSSTFDAKANERRRKHLENGRRIIVSKTNPNGPVSTKTQPLKPHNHPSSPRKEPIPKAPYTRPTHAKLHCTLCTAYPDGFRGDHELRRHHERAHAHVRRVWICIDPHNITEQGWRPSRPLNICKQCNNRKEYNVYYNAAAHLRRAHFCPRKRGRKARGEERESRAGKAGGDWPPIEWLKANGWLQEIEVGPVEDSVGPDAGGRSEEGTVEESQDDHDNEDEEEEDASDDPSAESSDPALSPLDMHVSTFYPPLPPNDVLFDFPAPLFEHNPLAWSTDAYPLAPAMQYTLSAPPVMSAGGADMMYDFRASGVGFY